MTTWSRAATGLMFAITLWGLRPVLAQPPSAGPGSEVQLYEKFRIWQTQQPPGGRAPDLLDRYRGVLAAEGLSAAEIARHLRVITEQGQRLDAVADFGLQTTRLVRLCAQKP
jgi:hypothetical protein